MEDGITSKQLKSRVLVLDGSHKACLAAIRGLGGAAVAYHKRICLAFTSRYCKKRVRIKNYNMQERFVYDLIDIGLGYEHIIPIGCQSHAIMSRFKREFEDKALLPDWQSLEIARDKYKTYELCEKLKVPYPKGVQLVKLPSILKNRYENGKTTTRYIREKNEMVLQNYIQGIGYGFFGLYDKGKLLSFFMHKRIREYPPAGGVSVCAESFYDYRLLEKADVLMKALNWSGPVMVEFKCDKSDHVYKVLEINGKFWGSLDLAIACEINFPQLIVDHLSGKEVRQKEYPIGLKYQWLLNGELLHLFRKPKSILNVLGSLKGSKKDIWIKDPVPALYQLAWLLAG